MIVLEDKWFVSRMEDMENGTEVYALAIVL